MFLEYYLTISNGQIALPSRFRKLSKFEAVGLICGEKCIGGYPLTSATVQSKCEVVKLDGRGRISIPARLRKVAALGESIVFVGTEGYFELWPPALWAKEKKTCAEVAGLISPS